MEVHIEEMSSKVQAADTQSSLTPGVLRQIVQAVLAELQASEAADRRRQGERKLRAGSVAQPHPWQE